MKWIIGNSFIKLECKKVNEANIETRPLPACYNLFIFNFHVAFNNADV